MRDLSAAKSLLMIQNIKSVLTRYFYFMNLFLSFSLCCLLVIGAEAVHADDDNTIQKKAVDFDRSQLFDNTQAQRVKDAGNLSGRLPGANTNQLAIVGWFEYDFSVANS